MIKKRCKHEWNIIENTIRLWNNGSSKEAKYKCTKCHKEKWFDIFDKKPNKYVFREHNIEDISDGYHTFRELYYHRMILFSIICNTYSSKAWKSWKHFDGTMFDNHFVVGIKTEQGFYTYHYDKKYWDMFKVKELENAPAWDGHKPNDIDRLLSLL